MNMFLLNIPFIKHFCSFLHDFFLRIKVSRSIMISLLKVKEKSVKKKKWSKGRQKWSKSSKNE